jgi:polysaccharide biosynthesis transport protein
VAGLLLGLALAFLVSRLDRTVKSAEMAEALGLTILGILPTISGDGPVPGGRAARNRQKNVPIDRDLVVQTHPMSSVAECCRTIRTNLTFMSPDEPLRTFVVTSAGPREGKTTVATSLAITMAQSGQRVLLIDTDLRRPRLHRTFNAPSRLGVTSVLVGHESLSECVQETSVPGLSLLPCGPIPPNPAELLHTARFRDLMKDALQQFDRVIFDSPPLGAVTDAAIIAPQVDGAILVIKAKGTARDAARSAIRQLRDVSARIIGGILNDVDLSENRYGYGSYYYYHRRYYGQDDVDPGPQDDPPPPQQRAAD